MEATRKLYYEQVDLYQSEATVRAVEGDLIITDQTVFFAEGGGQVGDRGWIGDRSVVDTRKRGGWLVLQQDLPTVHVETEVVHQVEGGADRFSPGDRVLLRVDTVRRDAAARLHGALHLVMGRMNQLFGKGSYAVKGCRIAPEGARIDFSTPHRLGGAVLEEIAAGVAAWVDSDARVEMWPVENVPEVFIWHCEADPELLDQPCGGTHKRRLGEIGRVRLRRSREGQGLERVYVTLADPGDPAQELPQ
jgi:alanyl-tRNA synthetase